MVPLVHAFLDRGDEVVVATGRVASGRPDSGSGRPALERVLSDASFRTAAEHVSGEIAAMPSPHEVAELLQSRYG